MPEAKDTYCHSEFWYVVLTPEMSLPAAVSVPPHRRYAKLETARRHAVPGQRIVCLSETHIATIVEEGA